MTFSCTKFALIVVIALISFKWTTEAKEYDKIDEHTYKERGGRGFALEKIFLNKIFHKSIYFFSVLPFLHCPVQKHWL